jgi:hypothetical protein
MCEFTLDEEMCLLRAKRFEIHGWLMFYSWFIAGYVILFTKRYLKMYWFCADIIHFIIGLLIVWFTVSTSTKIYMKHGLDTGIHSMMGVVVYLASVALLFSGIVIAVWVRFWKEPVWTAFLANRTWAWVHRLIGYLTLALGAATITSGGINYANKQAVNSRLITWSWI